MSVVARWFPGEEHTVQTATGFIGLDAPNNEASITMGFHGAGWLGGNKEGPHRYQHGIYADVSSAIRARGIRTAQSRVVHLPHMLPPEPSFPLQREIRPARPPLPGWLVVGERASDSSAATRTPLGGR